MEAAGRSLFSGRLQWDIPTNIPWISENNKETESEDAVLELACFVKSPRICFDNVEVGKVKVQNLHIFNPGEFTETVALEKFPNAETGFGIEVLSIEELQNFEIQPQEQVTIQISWSPVAAGNFRHLIVFKWVGGQRLQVIILACAHDPNIQKRRKVSSLSKVFIEMQDEYICMCQFKLD